MDKLYKDDLFQIKTKIISSDEALKLVREKTKEIHKLQKKVQKLGLQKIKKEFKPKDNNLSEAFDAQNKLKNKCETELISINLINSELRKELEEIKQKLHISESKISSLLEITESLKVLNSELEKNKIKNEEQIKFLEHQINTNLKELTQKRLKCDDLKKKLEEFSSFKLNTKTEIQQLEFVIESIKAEKEVMKNKYEKELNNLKNSFIIETDLRKKIEEVSASELSTKLKLEELKQEIQLIQEEKECVKEKYKGKLKKLMQKYETEIENDEKKNHDIIDLTNLDEILDKNDDENFDVNEILANLQFLPTLLSPMSEDINCDIVSKPDNSLDKFNAASQTENVGFVDISTQTDIIEPTFKFINSNIKVEDKPRSFKFAVQKTIKKKYSKKLLNSFKNSKINIQNLLENVLKSNSSIIRVSSTTLNSVQKSTNNQILSSNYTPLINDKLDNNIYECINCKKEKTSKVQLPSFQIENFTNLYERDENLGIFIKDYKNLVIRNYFKSKYLKQLSKQLILNHKTYTVKRKKSRISLNSKKSRRNRKKRKRISSYSSEDSQRCQKRCKLSRTISEENQTSSSSEDDFEISEKNQKCYKLNQTCSKSDDDSESSERNQKRRTLNKKQSNITLEDDFKSSERIRKSHKLNNQTSSNTEDYSELYEINQKYHKLNNQQSSNSKDFLKSETIQMRQKSNNQTNLTLENDSELSKTDKKHHKLNNQISQTSFNSGKDSELYRNNQKQNTNISRNQKHLNSTETIKSSIMSSKSLQEINKVDSNNDVYANEIISNVRHKNTKSKIISNTVLDLKTGENSSKMFNKIDSVKKANNFKKLMRIYKRFKGGSITKVINPSPEKTKTKFIKDTDETKNKMIELFGSNLSSDDEFRENLAEIKEPNSLHNRVFKKPIISPILHKSVIDFSVVSSENMKTFEKLCSQDILEIETCQQKERCDESINCSITDNQKIVKSILDCVNKSVDNDKSSEKHKTENLSNSMLNSANDAESCEKNSENSITADTSPQNNSIEDLITENQNLKKAFSELHSIEPKTGKQNLTKSILDTNKFQQDFQISEKHSKEIITVDTSLLNKSAEPLLKEMKNDYFDIDNVEKLQPVRLVNDLIIVSEKSKDKNLENRKVSQNVNTEKQVAVPKFKHNVARLLLNQLIDNEWDEILISNAVNYLSKYDTENVSTVIVNQIVQDYSQEFDKSFTPPAPLLTTGQQKIFVILDQLKKNNLDIDDKVLELLEKKLLFSTKIEFVHSITRFYVALCKLHYKIEKVRLLCCQAAYYMGDLICPLFFIVLSMWGDVLPMAADSKDTPLAVCLVHIISLKKCKLPGYNFMNLNMLLNQYYGYTRGEKSNDEVFKLLLDSYSEFCSKQAYIGILMLCKNIENKLTFKYITTSILPLLKKFKQENKKDFIVSTVNLIFRLLDNIEDEEYILNIKSQLTKYVI